MSRRTRENYQVGIWRLNLLRLMFITLILGLGWRLADIQVFNADFLRNQGDARHLRNVEVAAHRGMILDRHGFQDKKSSNFIVNCSIMTTKMGQMHQFLF